MQLQSSSKVLLDYWENPLDFFVFEKKDNNVCIRYFKRVLSINNRWPCSKLIRKWCNKHSVERLIWEVFSVFQISLFWYLLFFTNLGNSLYIHLWKNNKNTR